MKSTIICKWFTILGFNILSNHFVGDIAGAYSQIPSGSEMSTPELFPQMWKLRKQNPGAYALEPLHNFADILSGTIGNKHMYMINSYFTRNYLKLMFNCYLSEYISCSNRYLPLQHSFSIFGNPDQMDLQVGFGMGSYFVTSHSDRYKLFFA